MSINSGNNQFVGINRGGKTTKIHAVVDGLGNLVHFILTDNQEHDCKAAIPLLSKLEIRESNILADRAYGTKEIRDFIIKHDANYTIPTKGSNPNPRYCDF